MTKLGWIVLIVFFAIAYNIYQHIAPTIGLYSVLSNPCKSHYLTGAEKEQTIRKIEEGYNAIIPSAISSDYNSTESQNNLAILASYYEFCEPTNENEIVYYFKKYEFVDPMRGSNYLWTRAMGKYRIYSEDNHDFKPIEDTLLDLEKESIGNYRARALLASAYNQGWSRIFRSYLNIPKSLYYSKLDGCETNNGYSYASYLHTLFHNYPDDKEYLKIAYAMLFFTKLNADKFYKYSDFESIEQNMTSRLDYKDINYVISNYQDIIAKECEGILSDHDQVPTEEKLMRYAFPLKSDNNASIDD